ncbi:MAG: sirohydrochlorin cobaltochelatase [Tissierellia bacterium]|nr:sirohydrochlorin cobaltochelatase [Tissierellia bacterium]
MNKGIIVASFGTTHEDTRKKTIENIENKIVKAFPDFHVMRAFTSRMVINRLKKNDNIKVFNEKEALMEMESLGINREDIYIQPLHIIPGFEYEKLVKLDQVHISKPLLYNKSCIEEIIDTMDFNISKDEQLVLFGHGSSHEKDDFYQMFNNLLQSKGYHNIFMVTAEGEITIDDIIPKLKENGLKKIVLQPFMIVAGDHAKNDMASDDEDSLKSILEKEGFEVEPRLIGLGEYDFICDMYIERLEESMAEKGE